MSIEEIKYITNVSEKEYKDVAASFGITTRDYFAAKAMAAIISKMPFQAFPQDWSPYDKAAIGAYDYADAMLRARENT